MSDAGFGFWGGFTALGHGALFLFLFLFFLGGLWHRFFQLVAARDPGLVQFHRVGWASMDSRGFGGVYRFRVFGLSFFSFLGLDAKRVSGCRRVSALRASGFNGLGSLGSLGGGFPGL